MINGNIIYPIVIVLVNCQT